MATNEKAKIGAGHAAAMYRQGLAELRGAFFNESNVAQPTQHGMYGTRTQGEIADDRKPEKDGPETEPVAEGASSTESAQLKSPEMVPEPPDLERE